MRISANIGLAFWSVLSRPIRSAFMVLTLAAGIAVVALASAIISGFGSEIERLSFGAYARSLVITPNYFAHENPRPPRLADLERLERAIGPDSIEGVAAWRMAYRVTATAGAQRGEIAVFGVRGDYRFEADMRVRQGQSLALSDLETARRDCMIGSQAADYFFPDGRAVGGQLRINGLPCRIRAVFARGDSLVASRFDNAVITPFDAAARYFTDPEALAPNEANRLTIVLHDPDGLHDARVRADRALRRAHGVPMSQPAPFNFADPGAPAESVAQQRALLSRLLATIAAAALLAGVIGYGGANWTATELRRRDIALQWSSGARETDIFLQFALESLLIGFLGGIAGIAIALTVGLSAESWLGWPAAFDANVFALSLLVGVCAGALAGAGPAYRAAWRQAAVSVRG